MCKTLMHPKPVNLDMRNSGLLAPPAAQDYQCTLQSDEHREAGERLKPRGGRDDGLGYGGLRVGPLSPSGASDQAR